MTPRHEATTTTDHARIRAWTEERGGRPATVRDTGDRGEHAGILRIAFRDDEDLDEISWDEFFEKFDSAHLAFLHQDRTKDGDTSRFFKFVERE
jgi:hypothetical protein